MRVGLSFLLLVLALCSLAGFLAPLHWFFDLFNHYRVQGLAASLGLLIIACMVSRKHAYVVLALVIINGGVIAHRLMVTAGIPSHAAHNSSATLTIIAANVLTSNQHYKAVLDMIAREKPDIVVLTETDTTWLNKLEPLRREYPHKLEHPREDNFGMAIYARLPFKAEVSERDDLPLATLTFDNFILVAAHPIPPLSEEYLIENKRYIAAMADIANHSDKPVLVAGDLNSTLWSSAITPLFDSGLKRINPLGIAYTWPTQLSLLAIQIDHFFGKQIAAADFTVLENIGSDHFPIKAEVVLGQ